MGAASAPTEKRAHWHQKDSKNKVAILSKITSVIPANSDKTFHSHGKFRHNIARKLMVRKDPFPSLHIKFMMGGQYY